MTKCGRGASSSHAPIGRDSVAGSWWYEEARSRSLRICDKLWLSQMLKRGPWPKSAVELPQKCAETRAGGVSFLTSHFILGAFGSNQVTAVTFFASLGRTFALASSYCVAGFLATCLAYCCWLPWLDDPRPRKNTCNSCNGKHSFLLPHRVLPAQPRHQRL